MHSMGHVVTPRAARYGKQLVSHLGRKLGGEWHEEGRGSIVLRDGRAELSTTAEALLIQVTGPDLDRLEDVVERHLVRFGEREELVVTWTRDSEAGNSPAPRMA